MQLKEYDGVLDQFDWHELTIVDDGTFNAYQHQREHLWSLRTLSEDHRRLFDAYAKHYAEDDVKPARPFTRQDLNLVRDSVLGTSFAKPVVKYRGKPEFIPTADPDGEPWVYARVDAINHPKLGTCTVRTSMVLSQPNEDGFETRNTIYQREDA